MVNRTQVCNVEIGAQETLNFLKVREVTKENIVIEISKTGNDNGIR